MRHMKKSPGPPSAVFNGSSVKRKFQADVMKIIQRNALKSTTYYEGGMLTSSEGTIWKLASGNAIRTPSSWGQPSSLEVDSEEARAEILKALGVDLSRSSTYRRFC